MRKRITFEIETEEEDNRVLEHYLRNWLRDNFRMPEKIEIKIEDLK